MTKTGKIAQGLNKAGAVVGGIGELGLPGGEAVGAILKGTGAVLSYMDQPPTWPGSAPILHGMPCDLLPPVLVGLSRRLEEVRRGKEVFAHTRHTRLFVVFDERSEKERYAMQAPLYKAQRQLFPKQPRPAADPAWPKWGLPPTVAAARGYSGRRDR